MATARDIKRRIQSIRNMGQMTKALQAVSASKVQRAQKAVSQTRAYAHAAWEVIVNLGAVAGETMHPLLVTPASLENVLPIVITGDRGLCGAYNQDIVRTALEFVENLDVPARYVVIGQRGRDLLWRRGENIMAEFHDLPVIPGVVDVSPIARTAIDEFLEGRVDGVYLVYTDFVNMLTQNPVVQPLLPLSRQEPEDTSLAYVKEVEPAQVVEYIYEPDASTILEEILPRFIELQVYQAVLEAHTSEHAARMVAMRNATENAEELVHDLTLDYNRARQKSITREILDIAGGAEALEKQQAAAGSQPQGGPLE